jgi:hypothetical protein
MQDLWILNRLEIDCSGLYFVEKLEAENASLSLSISILSSESDKYKLGVSFYTSASEVLSESFSSDVPLWLSNF